jgi:hypothetical protein
MNQNDVDKAILKHNIINPLYLDYIINPPNHFGSIWIEKAISKLNINQINIILRTANNSSTLYEKQIINFDKIGKISSNEFFNFNFSKSVLNHFAYNYTSNQLTKIDLVKYHGLGNLPPMHVKKESNFEYFFQSKQNKINDSVFFYPTFEKPNVIIHKKGNQINHINVIIDKGVPASEFMNKLFYIDSSLTSFQFADKTITYLENNLPIESFQLEQNWSISDLIKKWKYNEFYQPIAFQEWLHGTLIKDINIFYNENKLPKRYIFNKKKYYIIYKKVGDN